MSGGFRPLIERVIPAAPAALEALLDLLVEWNRRLDLTAARSPEELVDLFLCDAALLARHHDPGAHWVDVGSGAGAPGLPLAVLAPDLLLTLVEPQSKRVAFLRTALGSIGRGDVQVERRRSDALPAGGFDVACSRATLPPPEWLREGARLATSAVWVLLARAGPPSLDGWRVDLDLEYTWTLTGAARRALRYVPDHAG
jgi:16S rRNA (guanine527-N7)-methyltransferase